MNNSSVFYAVIALLGVMASFQSVPLYLFLFLFCLFVFFLLKIKKYSFVHLIVCICLFAVFFIRAEYELANNQTNLSEKEQYFELFFHEIGKIDGDRLIIEAVDRRSSEKLVINYRLRTEKEKRLAEQVLMPGMVCTVTGKLEEPSSVTNENGFDYKDYLKKNQIHWVLKPEQLNMNACRQEGTILTSLKKLRKDGISYLQTHFPAETIPLAAALLFGTTDLLSQDTMNHYRDLGLVHLLAISGLHIAIIVAIVNSLLLRIGITREKSLVLLIVCLPIYCVLTGASPSVNRAVLMTMLVLIMKRWGKRNQFTALDVISFTFLLYLFVSPFSIFHIGFQLSFLITVTLLISSAHLLKRHEHPVTLLLSTSFLSMVISAPLLLYFFFEFSISTLLVNLLYIPLFNMVILPYVLFGFVLHLIFGGIVDPLLIPLNGLITFTNQITEKTSYFPINTIGLGRPSPALLFLYSWGIFLFFLLWEKGIKGGRKILLFMLPWVLFTSQFAVTTLSSSGVVTFLDVDQGDCILISLPYGKGNYLIDTGGTLRFEKQPWQERDGYEVGEDTVVPFLKSKGIRVIDKLVLTHGDTDHAGGAKAVIKELSIRELVLPDVQERSKLETDLIQLALRKKTAIRFVHAGDSWQVDEHRFHILAPKEKSTETGNDGSIVLYTELGGVSWLFTGDLEKEGEARLMREYPQLSADILKVGHHGSKSSTTEGFIEQVSPKVAVISVGENNSFRHPHPEVVGRLEKRGIKILRTDVNGAITYTFKKEAGTFSVIDP